MNFNWSAFEAKVLAVIRKAMRTYNEKWVTADVVEQHVSTLTERFLKDHGQMFNRTRVEYIDKDGKRHLQAWLYPLHEILEMVEDGRIKELKE